MSFGKTEEDVGFDTDAFTRLARSRFPTKPAAHLAAIVARTERCCEHWLAGETKPDADSIARLAGHFGTALLPVLSAGVDWTARLAADERRERLMRELAALDDEKEG